MRFRFLKGSDESTVLFEISFWIEWTELPMPHRFSKSFISQDLKIYRCTFEDRFPEPCNDNQVRPAGAIAMIRIRLTKLITFITYP